MHNLSTYRAPVTEDTAAASGLRPAEWILAGYFAFTLVLAFALPMAGELRAWSIGTSAGVLGILYGLSQSPGRHVSAIVRNLLPFAGVLLAYRQMGWFAQPIEFHSLEQAWVQWDQIVLVDSGAAVAIEALGPVLPGLLEFLYLLTYVVGPGGLAVLAVVGRADRADVYLTCYVSSALAAYALYPLFPSEPPRTVFPDHLVPPFDTVFRRINWWILGEGGIHTSVFPSGHVASACGAALGLVLALPERKGFGRAMMALALGIGVATVYGRYHYAVDAVAGVATSVLACMACAWAFRARRRG